MIFKRISILSALIFCFFISASVGAATVNLNSPEWLGNLQLDKKQLDSIKSAFEKALTSAVDAEQQCGEAVQDCVVRAAREWLVDGDTYREMVIDIHTVGHASRAVGQTKGQWPDVAVK